MYNNDNVLFYAARVTEAKRSYEIRKAQIARAEEIIRKRHNGREISELTSQEIYLDIRTMYLVGRSGWFLADDRSATLCECDFLRYQAAMKWSLSDLKGSLTRYRNQLIKAVLEEKRNHKGSGIQVSVEVSADC